MVDFNLNKGDALVVSDRDFVVLQIDLLFETTPGDVLGMSDFGTKYEDYLYRLKFSASQMEIVVMLDLNKLDLRGYTPTVEATLLDGSERDIILIKIDLYKNNSVIEQIYKIS